MHFIDTHAHVYAEELTSDLDLIMKNAVAVGVNKIIMPAIDSTTLEAMLKVEQQFPEHCIAMMGLHPCYVKEDYQEELALVETWLTSAVIVPVSQSRPGAPSVSAAT